MQDHVHWPIESGAEVDRSDSPLRQDTIGVVCCTYGGGHTGVKAAISTGKYLGQILERLGSSVLVEWYWRGNISRRRHDEDLRQVAARLRGVLKTWPRGQSPEK